MRTLAINALILAALACVGASAQTNIRQVDFKNFTYPLSGNTLGHDRLKWLDPSKPGSLKLRNGRYSSGGFTLDSVTFADVTSDGVEDAIVVIHLSTGGTQQTDYVYIYSFEGKPKLLAYCHTGDRGSSGLYKVYGEAGKLIIELFDPDKRQGDCCSSGLVRTRYRWQDNRFQVSGTPEFLTIQIPEHSDT
jgi:hypothetical protein